MKRDLSLWQFAGFVLSALGGTLLHFLYDWSGKNIGFAPLSSVNESTWEHMKLVFFSLFIFALIQSCFFREYTNFWCAKLVGIVTGLILIPALFYTYNGAIAPSPDWINITIFFVAVASAFLVETRLLKTNRPCFSPSIAFVLISAIAVLFVLFTFFPPALPLFQDPVTGKYGR